MTLSDRDRKIILILLIILVIVLPYMFYIKDTRIDIETQKGNNEALQTRVNELEEMKTHEVEWTQAIEDMHAERDAIIALFPVDVKPANYIQFWLNTEYSSDWIVDEETGVMDLEYPMLISDVTFSENVETSISDETMDTGFVALTNTSMVTYTCRYDGIKYLLQYLMDYEDPMIFRNVTIEYDSDLDQVGGQMMLAQYAVRGGDRGELEPVNINPSVDDMRGGVAEQDAGIFGNSTKSDPLGTDEDVRGNTEPEVTEDGTVVETVSQAQ